jgi:hypothetical protein
MRTLATQDRAEPRPALTFNASRPSGCLAGRSAKQARKGSSHAIDIDRRIDDPLDPEAIEHRREHDGERLSIGRGWQSARRHCDLDPSGEFRPGSHEHGAHAGRKVRIAERGRHRGLEDPSPSARPPGPERDVAFPD